MLEDIIADKILEGVADPRTGRGTAGRPAAQHREHTAACSKTEAAARGKVFRDPPGLVRPVLTVDTASAAIVAPIESFFATAADKALDAQHRACARRRVFLERLPMPMDPENFKMLNDLVASIAEPATAVNFFPALDPAALARLHDLRRDLQTLILSDLGVGKTRAAARAATRFVGGGFTRPGERPPVPLRALFCVNDHKLAREVAATLNEEAPGIAVVWLGLKQPRYADQPDGETMCRRTEDAEMWIEAGGQHGDDVRTLPVRQEYRRRGALRLQPAESRATRRS